MTPLTLQRDGQPGSAAWAGAVEESGTQYAPGVQHSAWPVEALHPGSPPRLDMDRTAVLFSSGLPHLLPAERAHSPRCRDQALGPDTPQPLPCRWPPLWVLSPLSLSSCSPVFSSATKPSPVTCSGAPTSPMSGQHPTPSHLPLLLLAGGCASRIQAAPEKSEQTAHGAQKQTDNGVST